MRSKPHRRSVRSSAAGSEGLSNCCVDSVWVQQQALQRRGTDTGLTQYAEDRPQQTAAGGGGCSCRPISTQNSGSLVLQPLFQIRSSDCGAACLAMVANACNRNVSVRACSQRMRAKGRDGASVLALVDAAADIGLSGRAYRVGLELLHSLHPALATTPLCGFGELGGLRRGSDLGPVRRPACVEPGGFRCFILRSRGAH